MAGRPSDLNEKLKRIIIALYADGKTDAQVARIIGVSRQTLFNWRGSDPEFFDTIKETKSAADELVEAALFSRATGYSHPEEKVFCYEGQIITHRGKKHYPPDTTAGIFWMCNRQPDRWKRGMFVAAPQDQPPAADDKTKVQVPKTYEEFCAGGGYPAPYPKQCEMRSFGFEETEPRMLLGARGTGKTDMVTIAGTAYEIYLDWFAWKHGQKKAMDETNLLITKSKARNAAIVAEIASLLKLNGVELEKENASCVRVAGLAGKDHSVEALTVKSSIRGRHPKRVTMDDPVTDEDVSESMRLLVKRKYNEVMKLCSNVLVIGQPAHIRDLFAELRPLLKLMEVPHGTIPELDHDLEAQRQAGVDEASIQASYHLKIVQDGSSPFSKIQRKPKFDASQCVAFIDPSDGGDLTAMTVMGPHMGGFQVRGYAWKREWYHCLDDIKAIFKELRVGRLGFETNMTGTQPIVQLRDFFADMGIGVQGKRSHSNKHARILAAGACAEQIFLCEDSMKVYTDNVIGYEYGAKIDDPPDSLALCLEWTGLIRGKV